MLEIPAVQGADFLPVVRQATEHITDAIRPLSLKRRFEFRDMRSVYFGSNHKRIHCELPFLLMIFGNYQV